MSVQHACRRADRYPGCWTCHLPSSPSLPQQVRCKPATREVPGKEGDTAGRTAGCRPAVLDGSLVPDSGRPTKVYFDFRAIRHRSDCSPDLTSLVALPPDNVLHVVYGGVPGVVYPGWCTQEDYPGPTLPTLATLPYYHGLPCLYTTQATLPSVLLLLLEALGSLGSLVTPAPGSPGKPGKPGILVILILGSPGSLESWLF